MLQEPNPVAERTREIKQMGWKVANMKKKKKWVLGPEFCNHWGYNFSPKYSHAWLKAWPAPVTLPLSLSPCTAFLPLSLRPARFCQSRERNWIYSLRNCCAFPPLLMAIEIHQGPSVYPENDLCVCIYYTQAHPAFPSLKATSCFQHRSGPATPPTDLSESFPGYFLGCF